VTISDRVVQIAPARAAALAADGAVLLDVREPEEWAAGHIPGATLMPLGSLEPAGLPIGRLVVAVCRSGNRSNRAATALAGTGLDVCNLAGGMKAWAADGRPVTRDDGTSGTVA
jgi:rhodanese-related sulfurtransferase